MGGYTALMGDPGRAPLTLPGCYVEYQSAQYAYTASLAVLRQRAEDAASPSPIIDVSMLETLLSLSQFTTVMWTYRGEVRRRHGNDWQSTHPLTLYPCKDGWFGVSAVPAFWEAFTRMLGRPDLIDDPRFATNDDRLQHRAELDAIVAESVGQLTMAEILDEGQRQCRVPVGIMSNMAELLDDPHLRERWFWRSITDRSGRVLQALGAAFRYRELSPQPALIVAEPEDPTEMINARRDTEEMTILARGARGERPNATATASRPLAGVRILDLTHVWAGPLGTWILADFGAEVLKLEAATTRGPVTALPGARGMYPNNEPGDEPWNRHGIFNKLNRNKKGLSINLKTEAGYRLFLDLVAQSDVVIENFSASTMPSLKLDFPVLQNANPNIIYVAMPGYGTCGPYRSFVAYGPSVEPMTGLTSLTGYSEAEPRATAMALPDAMAGVTAAVAVVSALANRTADGSGGFVDLSMQEAGINLLGEYVVEQQLTGQPPAVMGNGHDVYAPHGTYRCKGDDDWIVIVCRTQLEWESLCRLAHQGWAEALDCATMNKRREHQSELDQAINAWTQGWDKIELMTRLQQHGVPAGAVMTAPEFMGDPHLETRGFFVALGAEHIDPIPYPGMPVLIDGQRGEGWHAAPKLGEHNAEVLQSILGLNPDGVQKLAEQGVLASRPPA